MADFKINYKGTDCRGTLFLYHCSKCQHEQEETHSSASNPRIACEDCGETMDKKITVPALDADFVDNGKSHNIGWDYDESKVD